LFRPFWPLYHFYSSWIAPQAAGLTCYTVYVFGMVFRDAECSLRRSQVRQKLPFFLLLHIAFLAAVYSTVSFSIRLAPELPRVMTNEGRKGSLFQWIVTFSLLFLGSAEEHWMRTIIRWGASEAGRS
jgi:hypothetical protein